MKAITVAEKPVSSETKTVRTEFSDPWRGGKMRMPLGLMATTMKWPDDRSQLARGFFRFISKFNKPDKRK